MPEVMYSAGKTPEQFAEIFARMKIRFISLRMLRQLKSVD